MSGPWRLDRPNSEPRFYPTKEAAEADLGHPGDTGLIWYDAFDYEHHNRAGYVSPLPPVRLSDDEGARYVRDALQRRLGWLRFDTPTDDGDAA